jgi:hypothetical protein
MAVNFTKAKTKKKKHLPKTKILPAKGQTIVIDLHNRAVDEVASIQKQIKAHKEKGTTLIKSFDTAMEPITQAVSEVDAVNKVTVEGHEYSMDFGPCANVTEFTSNMQKVHKTLGDEVFYEICKVGVTDLKKYLTPSELKEVIKITPSGARSKKFIKK